MRFVHVVAAMAAAGSVCAGAEGGAAATVSTHVASELRARDAAPFTGAKPVSPDWVSPAESAERTGDQSVCGSAKAIFGTGVYSFDNSLAGTDGVGHPGCTFFGQSQIERDVWFLWTAPADGLTSVGTCALTFIDTKIAVYAPGTVCIPDDSDLIGCSDDFCGLQSRVSFVAVVGQQYRIRIGVYPGSPGGQGQFRIEQTPVASNDCVTALPIEGEGSFPFNNSLATTDGAPHELCAKDNDPQTHRDVWWRWTARCTGPTTLSTCGLTAIDSELVVYGPGSPCGANDSYVTICDDQSCGDQTQVTFFALAGQEYLIRLGTYLGTNGGAGEMRIQCANASPCSLSDCQDPTLTDGRTSDNLSYRVADAFVPPANGEITSLCFWGGSLGYPAQDNFRVTYYLDDAGAPGTVIATFLLDSGLEMSGPRPTGRLIADIVPEREHSVRHPSVPVQHGQTVWVEVTNLLSNGDIWFWSDGVGGDGWSLQDGAPFGYTTNDQLPSDRAMCVGFESACNLDVNGDGMVGFADLNLIVSSFNTQCP